MLPVKSINFLEVIIQNSNFIIHICLIKIKLQFNIKPFNKGYYDVLYSFSRLILCFVLLKLFNECTYTFIET